MDILKLAQLPESKTLEYKRDSSSLDSILKTIVAFANTAGGILLIGVQDDHVICGLSNAAKVQEQVASAVSDRIRPQISPEFSIIEVEDKTILAIQVEHLPVPYFLADKGEDKGVYIRLGNSNRLASKEAIAEMKRARHQPFFDSAPCDKTMEEDLDKALIQKTFAKHDRIIDTAKLRSIGILVQQGKRLLASNAGIILFGNKQARQTYFPFAEVRCARFAGTTRAEFIDRLEIEGSILAAIDEVPKFIRRNTKMAGKFGAMRRRDIPEYPTDGIREALTNALVHANYELSGMRIFVAIYDDKLEIQNPGAMPPGMDIEQFKAGVSRIRNPVIARVFGELELVEEWGSGYKRIKDACQNGGYPEPTWEEIGTVVRVTFFPHSESTKQHELGAKIGTQLAPSQHPVQGEPVLNEEVWKLLEFCKKPRFLNEMMKLLNWSDRTKFRRKFIHPLLKTNVLTMTIPDKPNSPSQQYVITDSGIEFLNQKNPSG